MVVIKILLIMSFLFIFYQDLQERLVYWPLFVLVAIGSGILHFQSVLLENFLISVAINVSFILLLLGVIYLYSKFKLKIPMDRSIGLGDILLFIGLALSFSTISFMVIFVFSLFFSLVLFLFTKKGKTHKTVPLAGNISLFFALTYIGYWSGFINSVYSI